MRSGSQAGICGAPTQHAGRAALAAVLQQLHVSCAQGRTRLAPPALLVCECVHVCAWVDMCAGV